MAERMAVMSEPKAIKAQITNPTRNVRTISLKAAFLAFPEYFIRPHIKGWPARVKGKVARPGLAGSASGPLGLRLRVGRRAAGASLLRLAALSTQAWRRSRVKR